MRNLDPSIVKDLGGPEGPPLRLRGTRVLLAEDHPVNQEIAREILELSGALVTIANNGREAVDSVLKAKDPFDLVLMDIQMPVMDGFLAASLIRGRHSAEQLPIVAMTANAVRDERTRCLAAGMNDHIAKPIDLEELFQVIGRWLRKGGGRKDEDLPPLNPLAAPSLPLTPPGFELTAGLKRVRGNVHLLARLLVSFRADHEGVVAEIRGALDMGAADQAAALLHMLKGLAGNLGAERVCKVLTELDGAFRKGSGDRVEPLLAALESELQQVFDATRDLEGMDLPQPRRVVDETTSDDIAGGVRELSDLLRTNNMLAVQHFERLAAHLHPSAELTKLKSQLDRLDFKAALATLATIATDTLPER